MSELTAPRGRANIRLQLLATASALALLTVAVADAQAADSDRPTVWIEGGWHFDSVSGSNDLFVPTLDTSTKNTGFPSFTAIENAFGKTSGAEGSVSFQPKGSDWVFMVSGRYGRAQTTRHTLDKATITGPQMKKFVFGTENGGNANVPFTPTFGAYAIGYSKNSEAHAIVDFQAGKDIGIGLLGRGTDSVISFGARYAQMNAKSKGHSYANLDPAFQQLKSNGFFGLKYTIQISNHRSAAFVEHTESFQALGPSLSMKNTTGLLGTVDEGQLALDWGMNAALLFGRQKTTSSHHSTVKIIANPYTTNVYPAVPRSRSRSVTVPNLGGFAALSYRFTNAKISAGYRADFFFGAMDGGLDTRHSMTTGFNGPFATIAIGLGG